MLNKTKEEMSDSIKQSLEKDFVSTGNAKLDTKLKGQIHDDVLAMGMRSKEHYLGK